MLKGLGFSGLVGLVVTLAGFGILVYVEPIIAAGVALVLLGVAIVVHAAIRSLATKFGMGGMM